MTAAESESDGADVPRISETPTTVRFFVEDEVNLDCEASREGISRASVVRRIVRQHYRTQRQGTGKAAR